jgi:hypothetical protein
MSSYYYSDAQQHTIGPLSFDAIRSLRAAGVVTASTRVIETGASTWRNYADLMGNAESPAGDTYTAPPPPSADRVIRERAAAAADRPVAVAGTTAKAIQESFLETYRAASTVAEKTVFIACGVGLVAFFLPWASALGYGISGFGLARQATGLLWLLPVSLVVAFFPCYLNVGATRRQRILRARAFLAIGTFWMAIALFATVGASQAFGVASIGLYVTLVAAAALATGGFVHIGENLKK